MGLGEREAWTGQIHGCIVTWCYWYSGGCECRSEADCSTHSLVDSMTGK